MMCVGRTGSLDGWMQQQIVESAWSMGDGQCRLDGWVQQQIGGSA